MSTMMDRSTLLVIAILLTLAAVLILVVVRHTRKTYPGFGLWAGSMALAMGGTVSFLIMQQSNPWLALLTANLLLVAAFVLLYRGLLVFRGRTANYAYEVLLALAFFAGFVFFGFVRPSINGCIAVYSLCLGSAAFMGSRVAFTRGRDGTCHRSGCCSSTRRTASARCSGRGATSSGSPGGHGAALMEEGLKLAAQPVVASLAEQLPGSL